MPPRRKISIVKQDWADAQATAALKRTWLPCGENPVPYTEIPATPQQAEDLCIGCPLLEIHFEFAQAVKADKEVAGGFYWLKGKPRLEEEK